MHGPPARRWSSLPTAEPAGHRDRYVAAAAGDVHNLKRGGIVPRGWLERTEAGVHSANRPDDLTRRERQHVDAGEGIQGMHVVGGRQCRVVH
jgi:hypothetical protein